MQLHNYLPLHTIYVLSVPAHVYDDIIMNKLLPRFYLHQLDSLNLIQRGNYVNHGNFYDEILSSMHRLQVFTKLLLFSPLTTAEVSPRQLLKLI